MFAASFYLLRRWWSSPHLVLQHACGSAYSQIWENIFHLHAKKNLSKTCLIEKSILAGMFHICVLTVGNRNSCIAPKYQKLKVYPLSLVKILVFYSFSKTFSFAYPCKIQFSSTFQQKQRFWSCIWILELLLLQRISMVYSQFMPGCSYYEVIIR